MSLAGAISIVRSPFVSREKRARLVYQDKYNLATSSGVGTQQVFRANSIFDFDYTGTGHQPMYRDQIVAMYQYYKVLGVRVRFEWSTSNSNNGLIGFCAYNTTPPTSATEAGEFSRRPSQLLTAYKKCTGTLPVNIAAGLGLTETDYLTNSLYNAAVGGNPSSLVFLQFSLDCATATDTGATLLIFAEFDVLFTCPVDPGLS